MPRTARPPLSANRLRGPQDLGRFRVHHILIVSTLYDSFLLSEDGRLSESILREFLSLDPYDVPAITRVSTGLDALQAAGRANAPDMIITSMQIGDMTAPDLGLRFKRAGFATPVVGLAHDARDLEVVKGVTPDGLDRVYLWQGDFRILPAIVKEIEDRMNLPVDTGEMGVQAIILIEDDVRFYSSFLPAIYTELVRHSQALAPEGLNIWQRLLRLRARPKILLCHSYEEAWRHFERYREQVLGVISDMEFPMGGEIRSDAGLEFARRVREQQADVPVMLQSGNGENRERAAAVGAAFVLKGSPTLIHDLQAFMTENFGFGDFVFRLPDGTTVGHAHTLKALEEQLAIAPAESVAYHAARNHYSKWLKARTEFALAYALRPRKVSDFATVEDLRADLIAEIHDYRRRLTRGIVSDFDVDTFDPAASFCRIGAGSLGGKGRGLALVNLLVSEYGLDTMFEGVEVAVPPAVVLGTEVFDRFLDTNGLRDFAIRCDDEAKVAAAFREATLPQDLVERLAAYLALARYPLAIRSSSLLEDSRYQPFAGVYDTLMIPNADDDARARLRQLGLAIRAVYASTFTQRAKAYVSGSPYRLEEEKMAVIIQKVVGAQHGGRYYPDIAGVARSYNFYPVAPCSPDDGIAAVALGLGAAVVGGDLCFRFCPRHPQRPVQFMSVANTLRNSQREFHAVDLACTPGAGADTFAPHRYGLDAAERDDTLRWVGSTYSTENQTIHDGLSRPGVRLVTFAPLLKHGLFPLAPILVRLLDVCAEATGTPVEIEFAVTLSRPSTTPKEFGFLQVRPVTLARELSALDASGVEAERLICRSDAVLGHGRIDGIRDLVVVDFHRFDRGRSSDVASQVARVTRRLAADQIPFILIGVGRWGSAEPSLGIPVSWEQIAGASVIVEAGFRDMQVTPSQGTHFFQNLTARNIGYFTVNPDDGQGFVDWSWLAAQPPCLEDGVVRHVRLDSPVTVKMNGRKQQGVILKP